MTPQERQLLESLANRVASTAVPQKDPEAEALIREKIGNRPDALYILTQTVLIQEMALNQANTRIHDLQQQSAQPPQQPTSFLGRLFGSGAQQQYSAPPPPPQYAPSPQYAPQYEPPPGYYQQAPSQGSSFLRSAATTATGVAAGALAFEGIESLFGHHGGFGGGFGGYGSGGGEFLGGAPSETVINNYYDEPRGGGSERENFSNADFDPGLQDGNDSDISAADYDTSSDSSGDDSSSSDV